MNPVVPVTPVVAMTPAAPVNGVAVSFRNAQPVSFTRGTERLEVVGDPKGADINGVRFWRVRAVGDQRVEGCFDLRETDDGWVID